jgi:hypothetical protein
MPPPRIQQPDACHCQDFLILVSVLSVGYSIPPSIYPKLVGVKLVAGAGHYYLVHSDAANRLFRAATNRLSLDPSNQLTPLLPPLLQLRAVACTAKQPAALTGSSSFSFQLMTKEWTVTLAFYADEAAAQ